MATLKKLPSKSNIPEEIRQMKAFARKTALSKESARKFLISTGIYTAQGKLAAGYR